jgi:hypothetical protein
VLDVDDAQRWAAWTAALNRHTAECAVWLMWAGYLPQPADEDADPVARWTWLGGLYTDPVWGVAAHFPDLDAAAAALIAGACAAAQGAASLAQWDAVAELAADRIETAETVTALRVWDSVAELADAGRHQGVGRRRFGAGEAVASALLALVHGHDSAAGKAAVRCAVAAWRVGVPAAVRKGAA